MASWEVSVDWAAKGGWVRIEEGFHVLEGSKEGQLPGHVAWSGYSYSPCFTDGETG